MMANISGLSKRGIKLKESFRSEFNEIQLDNISEVRSYETKSLLTIF